MNEDNAQGGQLMKNDAVRQFFNLLMENKPDVSHDYSIMLWQMESMMEQLKAATHELAQAKEQLAKMQESPEKGFVSRAVDAVEKRLCAMQEGIMGLKDRIIEGAKKAVAGVKQTGVKALDKAISAMGIKETLGSMQENLSGSMMDIKQSIEKVETMGKELRSVGGHLKNIGRTAAGKELLAVDGGTEGRFQAAVLAPLRAERNILSRLNNLTLAAIGSVERLEQAAGKEQTKARDGAEGKGTQKGTVDLEELEPPPDKTEKAKGKPSVLKDLKEKKDQTAAYAAPMPGKERKMPEASL